jgi:hypothetical protein
MDGNMSNLPISILEFIAVNPVQAGEEWAMDIEETPVSAGIYIDGCDVIDIIKSIEKPYKKREGLTVGKDYGHIQASWLYKDLCEVTNDTSYSYKYGVYLFCCRDCGEPGCWSVRCNVVEDENYVYWINFKPEHRDWKYNLLYKFEKKQYNEALEKLKYLAESKK